ncbi:MAG TPA: VIT1/CCC1 transporter family protein [Candidatus Nanoarchaeia archaeon]|nr:VIT1/CCC1 transporter family protein [Candidatus Nanoarchaeia archaeon]
MGVAAAGVPNTTVLLAGFASMFAGAVSMAAGDYLSTKSQREVLDAQIVAEEKKLKSPKEEMKVLQKLYRAAKFTDKEIRHFVRHLSANKRLMLKTLAEEELGIVPEKFENPVRGAITIFAAFMVGSVFPILPFFLADTRTASVLALIGTGVTLFAVGAYKTKLTQRNWLKSGIEMLAIAILAAVAGYAIGSLFGVQVS